MLRLLFSQALEDSESRFAALDRSQATLRKQLNGENTPWTSNDNEGRQTPSPHDHVSHTCNSCVCHK